jgi:hypothetical protein
MERLPRRDHRLCLPRHLSDLPRGSRSARGELSECARLVRGCMGIECLGDPRPANYDHNEMSVAVAYLDLVAASVSYQPDATSYSQLGFAQRRSAVAYEVTARQPLPKGFAAIAGAGYYDLHDLFGVSYWAGDLGLSYIHGRLTVEISRFFCDSTAARLYEDASANRTWAASAVLRF